MPPRNSKRGKNKDNARRSKKKVSILTQEKVEYVDWKDVNLLRRFISDRAKIRARRVTGNSAQQQREIVSRILGLLPDHDGAMALAVELGEPELQTDTIDPIAPTPPPAPGPIVRAEPAPVPIVVRESSLSPHLPLSASTSFARQESSFA